MTKRQSQVTKAILDYQLRNGRSPTLKELGERLGICPRAVTYQLVHLETLGYLRRDGSGSYGNGTRVLEVVWPAKNIIRPKTLLWRMVDGELLYGCTEVGDDV